MLQLENIQMSYDSKRVILQEISLKVEDGDYCVIFGPSGTGKSTLLNIITGLVKPVSGTIRMDETDIFSLKRNQLHKFRNEKIGYLTQESSLIRSISILDNVCLPHMLYNKDINKKEVYKRGEQLLDYVGMLKHAKKLPGQLSGGEKKRVEIARCLINKPKYIILDEPTANLDEENVSEVLGLLKRVNEDYATLIISTHDVRVMNQAIQIIEVVNGNLIKR